MSYTYKVLNKSGDISVYCNGILTCIIDTDTAKKAGYKNAVDYFNVVFKGD